MGRSAYGGTKVPLEDCAKFSRDGERNNRNERGAGWSEVR